MPPVVVLDTNVFISALLGRGACRELVARWRAGAFTVTISLALLRELRRVLARPALTNRISPRDRVDLVDFVEMAALRVKPLTLLHRISRDPSDDKVFACAFAAGAMGIVSGDADVLSVTPIIGLRCFTPAGFLAWLARPR